MSISSGGKLKIEKSYLQSRDNFLQVMKRFVKWLVNEHEEVRKPEDIEPRALNRYIGLFLVNLKRVKYQLNGIKIIFKFMRINPKYKPGIVEKKTLSRWEELEIVDEKHKVVGMNLK